jgi:hypothetical protein
VRIYGGLPWARTLTLQKMNVTGIFSGNIQISQRQMSKIITAKLQVMF